MKKISDQSVVVALVMAGEAASEGQEGMQAVASVIANRMIRRNKTAYEVVTESKQFSAYEDMAMCERNIKTAAVMEICTDMTRKLLLCQGSEIKFPDNTDGADHYITVSLYKSKKCPSWIRKMKYTKTIGRHIFFNSRG